MPSTVYDAADTSKLAEGRHTDVRQQKSIYDNKAGTPPTLLRFVVLEVISDPSTIDKTKLGWYQHTLQVANIDYATIAPRNSIIARRVMSTDSGASDKVMVLYPFFPSHLAFPCKPGEHVWGLFENSDAKSNELGYWLCRITQPSFVEDVNYTHADRQWDQTFLPGISDTFEGTDDPKYEFRNGAVDASQGNRYTVASTASLPDDEAVYESLMTTTDASKQMKYEAVPRFRKRPGDVAFEGSNNTLIVLGTDRTGKVAEYTDDPNQGKIPKPVTDDIAEDGCGAIDIVAGRGQVDTTFGKEEASNTIAGAPTGFKEIGKTKKDLAEDEGDPSFLADRSRIYVAGRTKVDTNFGLNVFNADFKNGGPPDSDAAKAQLPPKDDDKGDAAIVVKSDKVRLIARSDLEIIVTGILSRDAKGRIVEDSSSDSWACIILKVNGDIVFKPSAKGLIRLGGDDADLSPLCSRVGTAAFASAPGPIVPASIGPIVDTMGGTQGKADGLNGTFPTRILMK